MNVFQKTENLNIALTAARHIGCHVVNIGSSDIIAGRYDMNSIKCNAFIDMMN